MGFSPRQAPGYCVAEPGDELVSSGLGARLRLPFRSTAHTIAATISATRTVATIIVRRTSRRSRGPMSSLRSSRRQ